MHEYRIPMRWADLDSLNHVNNVVYLGYAAEARAMLADDGVLAGDHEVRRMAVDFLQPLLLSRRSVLVRTEVDGDVLSQEITSTADDAPVYARVRTEIGARSDIEPGPQTTGHYPLRVRRWDLDGAGEATEVKVFEYFQEGRIALFGELFEKSVVGQFVVAHVDVEYARPITWRLEPYDIHTRMQRVGGSSLTTVAEISDGEHVLARATAILVGFDLETQRSRRFGDEERAHLEGLVDGR